MRFFFYGTLMDEAVREAVLGPSSHGLAVEPATLAGWRRARVRGRHYPIVVPAAGQSVTGLLADGIGTSGARRLDRFEAAEYHRVTLETRAESGALRPAWVYVAIDASVAAAAVWDFEDWRRTHKPAFLRRLAAGGSA